MMRRLQCVAVAAATVWMSTWVVARGVAAETPNEFTVAASENPFGVSARATDAAVSDGAASGAAGPLTSAYIASVRYEATRYRPRRERPRDRYYYDEPRRSRARGVSQLHAGFLDPEGPVDPGFVVGFRGGQQIDDVFQIGLGIDWRNKSGRDTEVLQETVGPGGEVILVRREISRYSSNLFPAIVYLQLQAPGNMGIIPYFGVAGSWQVLFLEADDFQTGETFDATFDGFGWQLWGGAALPLSGRARLVGEAFLNDAELNRDVFDPTTGTDIRETVSTDGIGGRFGISWAF